MLFWAFNFFFSSTASRGHYQRFFLNFRFSSRKFPSQQKLAEKITHFTIQFRSTTFIRFTNLNSFDTENNMFPQQSWKPFSLYKFSCKHFFIWCQKKHLHWTISWRPRTSFLQHFESKYLYISVYLCKKTSVPETE